MDQENTKQMRQQTFQFDRPADIEKFKYEIQHMLAEKVEQYGVRGGFYETNYKGVYEHALGEAKLKMGEFAKTGNRRMLIKAATWLYLIYEMEIHTDGL